MPPTYCKKLRWVLKATFSIVDKTGFYLVNRPTRPLVKRFGSPVPARIRARRNRNSVRAHTGAPSFNPSAAKSQKEPRTGYTSLPPELRYIILEHALETGAIWPYGGLTAHQTWQRDFDVMVEARREAWKAFVRHPTILNCKTLLEMNYSYRCITDIRDTPSVCLAALGTAPHLLSVSRTIYDEGHKLFYTRNIYHVSHGPLSTAKLYYDHLRPEHRKLIRKMVLDISPVDLTVEAFNDIEDQLRTGESQLSPDRFTAWAATTAAKIISIWRSKLVWLQEWTWLVEVDISFFLTVPHLREEVTDTVDETSPKTAIHVDGESLPCFLKGISGPVEPHDTLPDIYGDCDEVLAWQMRCLEEDIKDWLVAMIDIYGWRCFKAYIRQYAYKDMTLAYRN